MVLTRTHGIDKDLWYRQQLMVLTTPIVLTKTHGIELVILNHTRTRGPSGICMRDFLNEEGLSQNNFTQNSSVNYNKSEFATKANMWQNSVKSI